VQVVERVQRAWFPRLWEQDQAFVESVSHAIGPEQAIVLGLSAGIGEELTLRGALQPRFGLVATAALFAVLHVQYSWIGILAVFLIGVLFGIVRRVTSTTAAIAIHVLYDAIVVAATAMNRG
jgi:membrane protease YdiL (CAAX protease family)